MKNILFDVDGVIVDTEKLNLESWKLIYKIKDELFSTLYFSELVGNSGKEITNKINSRYGANYIYTGDIQKQRKEIVCGLLTKGQNEVYSDSAQLLKYLSEKGYDYGFVTTGNEEETKLKLGSDYIKEYTQGRVIVSSSDIREEQRKPNEQHYEVALKRTGFNSDNTIVVEDSPIGIISAVNSSVNSVYGIDRVGNLSNKLKQSEISSNKLTVIDTLTASNLQLI